MFTRVAALGILIWSYSIVVYNALPPFPWSFETIRQVTKAHYPLTTNLFIM